MRRWMITWPLLALAAVATVSLAAWYALDNRATTAPLEELNTSTRSAGQAVRVDVVQPEQGGIERTTTRPGTVIAFESAQLFAKVSGFLKSQSVDIGSHVERGEVLAELDAPELSEAVQQAKAVHEQAIAQAAQAEARIATVTADRDAALAAVKQADAEVPRTRAAADFREKQYGRIRDLFKLDSIDERLVDEKQSELVAAQAAVSAAEAGVENAKAQASAAGARIEQAKADAAEARAKVDVAAAALAKAQVFVEYLKIVSPYNGVVTKRNFFRGDFIQSADQNSRVPLLAVDRTDLMRVVVQVADEDVPFTNAGDEAVVEIDALPGVRFDAKVARVADAEDTESRTMRTEIDLPNPDNTLRQGMYGRVTIQLGRLAGAMRIPSSCLVGSVSGGDGKVYVERDGVVHLLPVRVGADNGIGAEILAGLSVKDRVVKSPPGSLSDGAHVTVVEPSSQEPASSAAHEK